MAWERRRWVTSCSRCVSYNDDNNDNCANDDNADKMGPTMFVALICLQALCMQAKHAPGFGFLAELA